MTSKFDEIKLEVNFAKSLADKNETDNRITKDQAIANLTFAIKCLSVAMINLIEKMEKYDK